MNNKFSKISKKGKQIIISFICQFLILGFLFSFGNVFSELQASKQNTQLCIFENDVRQNNDVYTFVNT